MNKRKILIFTSTLIILLTVTLFSGGYYFFKAPQFFPIDQVRIYIDTNDIADSVIYKLKRQAEPKNFVGFVWMAQIKDLSEHIHTGSYIITPGESVNDVYNKLTRGHQSPVRVTLGSTRTLGQMAKHLSTQLMIDSIEIAKLINDSSWIAQQGYTPETISCLFIPNTYEIYWNVSAKALLKRLIKEHEIFWNKKRMQKAINLGMTPCEITTLASIVEEETNNTEERPIVAGLYLNRLKRDIPLQADPTIKYAWQDFSLRRISNKHLEIKSPYNTYRNKGLPPGPIRITSPQAINSVLNYTKHNYLYMCAKDDFSGSHNFSTTYAEHRQNARKYWRALNKKKIFR